MRDYLSNNVSSNNIISKVSCSSQYNIKFNSFDSNETVIDATTNSSHSAVKEDEIFWMFRISFWYYGLLGLIIMVVVSYVVSILTGGYSDELDERLLTPLFRSQRYKDQLKENEAQYKNIDTALRELNQQNDA